MTTQLTNDAGGTGTYAEVNGVNLYYPCIDGGFLILRYARPGLRDGSWGHFGDICAGESAPAGSIGSIDSWRCESAPSSSSTLD